jgi:hypothetical protein
MMSLASITPRVDRALDDASTEKADYTLHIGTGLVELAPEHIISTTLYNGHSPDPDETTEITILKQNGATHGFNRWTLNGEVHQGGRYGSIPQCQ